MLGLGHQRWSNLVNILNVLFLFKFISDMIIVSLTCMIIWSFSLVKRTCGMAPGNRPCLLPPLDDAEAIDDMDVTASDVPPSLGDGEGLVTVAGAPRLLSAGCELDF